MAVMFSGGSNRLLLAALMLLVSCVSKKERGAQSPAPRLDAVVPDKVLVGEPFQTQPDGTSAIAVSGENLVKGTRVRLYGQPLNTSYSGGKALTATVPPQLVARDGIYPVSVETPDGQVSNSVPFFVMPKTGPAPVIRQLFPDAAQVGKPFNEQPDGQSALGLIGDNFLPGVTVEINGEPQKTNFPAFDTLSAFVPAKFLTKPGALKITVRNRDGKVSAPVTLALTPAR